MGSKHATPGPCRCWWTESPLVATGLEDRVARIHALSSWRRRPARFASLLRQPDHQSPRRQAAGVQEVRSNTGRRTEFYVYQIRKFMRSNAAPASPENTGEQGRLGQKGQVIADGPCTQGGELALAGMCFARSCPGTVITSRTPSSSANAS